MVGKGERVGGTATNSTIFKDSTCLNTVTIMFNCDTLHSNKHYRRTLVYLHSLPELTTAVVGSVSGVGVGDWFGGAALNNTLCEDSTCLNAVSIMLICDTLDTNEQHN